MWERHLPHTSVGMALALQVAGPEITLGGVQETLWDDRDRTQVGCMGGKHPIHSTSTLLSTPKAILLTNTTQTYLKVG